MHRTLLFWTCVVLVALETAYGFYWGAPNIAIRMGLIPDDIMPGLHELIPTLNWVQETLFFAHILFNTGALVTLLYRWALCIPLFALAFLLDRIDWIILGMNPIASVRNENGENWTAVISQFGGFGLMGWLQLVSLLGLFMLLQYRTLAYTVPSPFSNSASKRPRRW